MISSKTINNFLEFYKKAEKLKTTMRHSWLSDKARQESSAEHSWMLGLLAMVLFDQLDEKVDKTKVLKMVLVHDLAEAITGDIPAFKDATGKFAAEIKALTEIVSSLPRENAKEIMDLFKEFEVCQTEEAKFANSLDKIEVLIQHNIADISTWDQGDYDIGPYYKDHFFNFDDFMRAFKDRVDNDTMEKIISENKHTRIDPKHHERYKKNKRKK